MIREKEAFMPLKQSKMSSNSRSRGSRDHSYGRMGQSLNNSGAHSGSNRKASNSGSRKSA